VLADQQIEAFLTFGYCVTRVSVPEASVDFAIKTVWDLCPSSFHPDNPESWHGEFEDCCKTQSLEDRRGRVKFRKCLRGERWLYDLTAGNGDIVAAVADLIGVPVTPQRVRGLYPVFPTPAVPVEGHCDKHKFQVGVVLYLSSVPRQGGGFTVWPGSHQIMAKHHGTLGGNDRLRSFNRAVAQVEKSIQPIEVIGGPGTVVLWHQRLVHTAGINTRPTVRHATLCDFKNTSYLAAADRKATDIWETWSPRVRELASAPGSRRKRTPETVRFMKARIFQSILCLTSGG